MTTPPIDPRVQIGHVHLKVSDIDRSLEFYCGVLGFEVVARLPQAAFISAGGYHHHIGLNTWHSRGGSPPPAGHTGLYHVAILYPDRATLGDALRRAHCLAGGHMEDPRPGGSRTLLNPDLRGCYLASIGGVGCWSAWGSGMVKHHPPLELLHN
jgi:catechol-2,3-dioxygenase